MLGDIFIERVIDDSMKRYAEENSGKTGIAKVDVVEMVMALGGDMDDVRRVMYQASEMILNQNAGYHTIFDGKYS